MSPVATGAVVYLAGGGGRCLALHSNPPAMTTAREPAMASLRSHRRLPSSAASARRSSSVTAVVVSLMGRSSGYAVLGLDVSVGPRVAVSKGVEYGRPPM